MLELNKIHLGDAYELIKQIPDKSVDCIYTDVPYEMTFSGGGTLKHKLGKYIKEEVESFSKGIDIAIYTEFVRVVKNLNIFIWLSKSQILQAMTFFDKYEADMNILTWTKTNPIPFGASIWLSDIEYCLHIYKNAGFNQGWENKHKNFSSPINNKDKKHYDHATIKPLEMVKKHLLNLTQPNDIILDPFIGSGTTAVAAQESGRQFIGFEINEKWHKIACDRVNGITAGGQISIFGRKE